MPPGSGGGQAVRVCVLRSNECLLAHERHRTSLRFLGESFSGFVKARLMLCNAPPVNVFKSKLHRDGWGGLEIVTATKNADMELE